MPTSFIQGGISSESSDDEVCAKPLSQDESEDDLGDRFIPHSHRSSNRRSADSNCSRNRREFQEASVSSALSSTEDEEDYCNDSNSSTVNRGRRSHSRYHKMVFPNMEIPVRVRPRNTKNGNDEYYNDDVYHEASYVPRMSVECPFPGGTTVTTTTDPVQSVKWGPITRVEASKEARDLIKKWKRINRQKGRRSKSRRGHKANNSRSAPCEVVESSLRSRTGDQDGHENDDEEQDERHLVAADEGAMTTSQAETDTQDHRWKSRRRPVNPPPPTPPTATYYDALSMPTVPIVHSTSDLDLVETYREQRAKGPAAFDKDTRAIKRGLVQAKVARGGSARLLANEYTVELASREVATIAEKWANGRTAGSRSRSSTVDEQSEDVDESTKTSAGKAGSVPTENNLLIKADAEKNDDTSPAAAKEHIEARDPIQLVNPDDSAGKSDDSKVKASPSAKLPAQSRPNPSASKRRKLKDQIRAFDLPSHVSKITTHGSIRHQHSVKREIGDHGEKRTVTTWIQIEEVYEVPAPAALKWTDVVDAVELHANHHDKDDADGERIRAANNKHNKKTAKNKTRKHIKSKTSKTSASRHRASGRRAPNKNHKKTKRAHDQSDDEYSSTSSSGSSDSSSSPSESSNHKTSTTNASPQSQTEALLHSLSQTARIRAPSLDRLIADFQSIIATLSRSGDLETTPDEEEEDEDPSE